MNEQLSLTDWLAQKPLPEEVKFNEDGSSYIPVEYIKPKLNYLSPNWSSTNFKHNFYNTPDGKLWCSASIELHIGYMVDLRTDEGKSLAVAPLLQNVSRTLSGAATFDVQKYYPNTNWGQTALSLSIVAAAKELGDFFGKSLNKEMLTVPTVIEGKKDKKSDKLANTIKNLGK
jgi:hypothetical protein